jgi:WD40 repeat protein
LPKNYPSASGSFQEIKIWDISSGSLKRTLTGHSGSIFSLAVLQNGDLASGSRDKTIKIWDSSTWELKRTLVGHSVRITSLAVLHDGNLASQSYF